MQKKLLIVDDQPVNRRILKKLLCDQYEILEAEDGQRALELLREQGDQISAVLLDLIMPVLDGYQVLAAMSQDPKLSDIPVIVASQTDKNETEERALELGARDFVSKPYNPAVLRKRLGNLIELRESNLHIDHMERDALTGLYSKEAFCRRAAELLEADPAGEYILVATDIERFKLVNDSFGAAEGDRLLKFIADHLDQKTRQEKGLCARLNADHFVAIVPKSADSGGLQSVVAAADQDLAEYPLSMKISLKFGVYPIQERDVPIEIMCDRAILAAESVKGQYQCVCAYYDDSIRQRMLREQEITDAMKDALTQEQFKVYLQPKYDLQSERIAGAEALVRWEHPKLGFLNPGEFVPLFEGNGFITELDRYVWDKTCGIIEQWIGLGKKYVPVSVNVSRKDIYQVNLPEVLTGIVRKHGLRPSQLHLEITETAYTENPEQLIEVVGELKQLGFVIEMDDFGSGYSSLNMLSELPIDILKLDMRFIQKETDRNSSRNILSFIISLAKWMNLLVIAEGVETQQQIDLLRNMDCNYVQGYYYAKPMPAGEFTKLVLNAELADPISTEERDWQEGSLQIGETTGDKVMLLVDDVQLNRAILAEYFQNAYTIVEADNGQVAFSYIQDHFDEIAIVMLDLVMPVMDGFQLLKRLRANPLYSGIPVIVTSQAGETSEAHAFELGASDFLPKPYNIDIALHRVQNVTARNAIQTLEREKRMLSKMKRLALEAKLDQLTGLYNRMEMERQVREFLATDEKKHALFFMLDIDNFKNINDLYGHDQGDEAIRMVAGKLQEMFREDDLVCRMGGDEFAVFVRTELSEDRLARRLDRLCEKLRFRIEKTEVTCSVGVCIAPEHGTEYQNLYHNADVALLTAKRLGKNRYQVYGGEADLPDQILYRNMDWLLDESSDAVYICDAKTYQLYYLNGVACALAGKDKKTCLSQPCYQAIWGQSAPCSHCVHISKLTRDYCEHEIQPGNSENSYIIKGKLIDWGTQEARIQYVQDNTSRANLTRQMEALSEDRRMLLDLLPGGLIRYNARDQKFNFISENTLHMLGYTRTEFFRKFRGRFDCMVWHEDRQRILEEIRSQISVSDYDTCQYRIQKKDGSLCWVYDAGHLHRDETGGEYYVMLTDMTAQKKMEEENRLLTARLETVINNVPGALCLYRWDGQAMHALQISRQFSEILGASVDEAMGRAGNLMVEPVHPDDLEAVRRAMGRVLFQGEPMDCVFRVFHKTCGQYLWLRMQAVGKQQPDGQLLIYALYTDITELHHLRFQLQQQRDMLAAAMEHSGMASWVYDFATGQVSLDKKTQERLGLPENLPHLSPAFQKNGEMDPGSAPQYQEALRKMQNGEDRVTLDVRITRAQTGEQGWQRIMYTVIGRDEQGRPEKAIGTSLDVTEQKIAEQNYREKAAFLNALSSSLLASYRINLTTGVVEEAHSSLHIIENAKSIQFDDENFHAVCTRFIPLEREREVCFETFRPAQLKRDYKTGRTEKTYEYPAKLPGQRSLWLALKVKLLRKPSSGELVAFFSFWNIDREKRLKQVVDALMQTEFDAICLVDAETGSPEVIQQSPHAEGVFVDGLCLQNTAAAVERSLRINCVEEDVERAVRETSIEAVRAALEKQPLYSVAYHLRCDGAIRVKRASYRYLDAEKTTILCTIRDDTAPWQSGL